MSFEQRKMTTADMAATADGMFQKNERNRKHVSRPKADGSMDQ
jgi:hypothetical protein